MKIKYPIGGYAPGNYQNKCAECGEMFIGDKLARQCEPCAINAVNEANKTMLQELRVLRAAVRKFKEGQDAIINTALGK